MKRVLYYECPEGGCSLRHFLKTKGYPKSILSYLQYTPERIFCDGEPARLNQMLSGGEKIEVRIREEKNSEKLHPADLPLKILYEDEDILVVDKPAGMPMHSSIHHYTDTLANAVAFHLQQEYGEENAVFRCMNRLDRDTTGVTVAAKNALSAAVLGQAVREHRVHREYLAIVSGAAPEEGKIDVPIGRVGGSVILRQAWGEDPEPAETEFQRLLVFDAENRRALTEEEIRAEIKREEAAAEDGRRSSVFSLLSVRLKTGRTHQIRIHMGYIGHPLPGDFLYHPDDRFIGRQALHSRRMTFFHPITGEEMTFTAPLPEDMRAMLPEGLTDLLPG